MSRRVWSVLYLVFALFFIYSAYLASVPNIWNWKALLFVAFAAFDIQVGLAHWFGKKKYT
jgi:hypothetical protein